MTQTSKPTGPTPLGGTTADRAGATHNGTGLAAGAGRHAAPPTVGQLVSDASTHLAAIIHGEVELAKLELKTSIKNAGTGSGAFLAAAAILPLSLPFVFVALAELLTRYVLPRWASYLVVFGFFLIVAALLGWIGFRKVKRIRAPERTIATSKDTVAYLKANAKRN